MSVVSQQPQSMSQLQRSPGPSGLADVLSVILDKGIVIDIFARVALVGIELLTVDVRIVIASVDTYLRFAEAVNRLDLTNVGNQKTLPDLLSSGTEDMASSKTKGMLTGAKEALFGGGDDDEDETEEKSSSSGSSSGSRGSSSRSRSSSGSRSRGR